MQKEKDYYESDSENSESSEIILEQVGDKINRDLFPKNFDGSKAQSNILPKYFFEKSKKHDLELKDGRLTIETLKRKFILDSTRYYKVLKKSIHLLREDMDLYYIALLSVYKHLFPVVFNKEDGELKNAFTCGTDPAYERDFYPYIQDIGEKLFNKKNFPIHHIESDFWDTDLLKMDNTCSITAESLMRAFYKMTENYPEEAEKLFDKMVKLNEKNQRKFKKKKDFKESKVIKNERFILKFNPKQGEKELSVRDAFKWYALRSKNKVFRKSDILYDGNSPDSDELREKVFDPNDYEELKKIYKHKKKSKKIEKERRAIIERMKNGMINR